MRIEAEILIDAPWTHVFTIVTDVRGWPQRIPAISAVSVITPGPVAVGTRFSETRTMFGRSATEEMMVAELVVPERFVVTADNHGTRYRAEHLLTEEMPRCTRLRLVFSGVPVSLMARLLTPLGWLMKASVRRMILADLAALKRASEATSTPRG